MRRKLVLLATATSLSLAGAISVAGPAAAAPSDRSVHFSGCPGYGDHQGRHLGWSKQPSTERRNVGGTCPVS